MKPITRLKQARADIEAAANYYLDTDISGLAEGFLDELDAAFAHVQTLPKTGSMRYASRLGIRNLRFWILNRFPYMLFYVERAEHIDLVRVLHQATNIPQHLQNKP